jgi:hypothetical protein
MTTPHPAPDTPEHSVFPAAGGVEEDLAILDFVAKRGAALIQGVKDDGTKDSADAFHKFAREVRLAIMVKARLREGPPTQTAARVAKAKSPTTGLDALASAEPASEAAGFYAALEVGRKARVRELVRDVIGRETPDPEEADTLGDALDERLLYDDAYDDVEALPLRDVVEHLSADLELKPDWSRWDGEGWKPNPPFWRPRCSLFTAPSRRPILNDLPDDEPDPHPLE